MSSRRNYYGGGLTFLSYWGVPWLAEIRLQIQIQIASFWHILSENCYSRFIIIIRQYFNFWTVSQIRSADFLLRSNLLSKFNAKKSIFFPFTITSHLPSFNNFISIDNTSSEMANSYTFQCSWNYKKSTWQTRRYMPVHAHCLNCLATESETILCHNIFVLLFANYLCCALFFFQHYWKVLRLIVPTFFFW